MRRSGLGPYRSMRMPSGSVAALSRKEPMVKPRLSISSCSTQLSQSSWASVVTLAWVSVSFSSRDTEGQGGGDKRELISVWFIYEFGQLRLLCYAWLTLNGCFWACCFSPHLEQLTCAKVWVKTLVLQHDEQGSPTKQHSRKSQVFHHCCAGHPPSPPVRLRQWGCQPSIGTWRKSESDIHSSDYMPGML